MTVKPTVSPSLLFEIGIEEIPAGYFAHAKASILAEAPSLLEECGFQFDQLNVFTTPRRFVIYADNFKPLAVQEEEKLGPFKDQAYQNGAPTPALLGFLKNVNRSQSDVFFKDSPRGPRVSVKMTKERKPLRYFFETLPRQIEFPKLMRWEASRFVFARPIRWTFAFVGMKLQTYKIGDVKSGHFSFGHRFLSSGKFKVNSSNLAVFERALAQRHVILKEEERINKIRTLLKHTNHANEELIQMVAHLVEEPFQVRGSFDKRYLKLPAAVLTTSMSKHQKIFACFDREGRLLNQFVAMINGPRKNIKMIVTNYESVLNSRLEDAAFFFEEDRKTKLEAQVSKLKEMIFLGSLGSYWDKTKRLEHLVQFLGKEAGLSQEVIRNAKRAAHLAKADLMTHLVYEFPELQGAAGSEYARLDGEEDGAASAILGHYYPANLSEDHRDLKKRLNVEGALVGISDRIDLLVGASGIGIELSGSQDPYALRRAAGGIVKILRAHRLHFSLSKLIEAASEAYGKLISKSVAELIRQLIPFIKERIIFELQLRSGSKEYEVLQGIFASGFDDIANVYERFAHLLGALNQGTFVRACKVMERTGNILKGVKGEINDHIQAELFQDALERHLFELLNQEEKPIQTLIHEKNYAGAVERYGSVFYQPVHDFFDQVLVNAEDPKIRANRQALVKKVYALCANQIADLSYVTHLPPPAAQS